MGMALREVYGPHVLSYLFLAGDGAGQRLESDRDGRAVGQHRRRGRCVGGQPLATDTATTLGWICAVVGCLLVVEYGFWNRQARSRALAEAPR